MDGGPAPRTGPEGDRAFGACRQDIDIAAWSGAEEMWRKWGLGCDSRSNVGHHAMYYTFTLTEETRVRMHAEGSAGAGLSPAPGTPSRTEVLAKPWLILRKGEGENRAYGGDAVHEGRDYIYPAFVRIDEVLEPGTYTLEVTTERPGIVGQPFRLKIGEPATPPTGPPAQCFVNIGPAESYDHAARWRSDCPATENPGSQAIYYRYTPDQTKSLRFTLTSPDAWEELYLWEDGKLVNQHSSQTASCHDRCARFIHLPEAGKDYIVEVASDGAASGGRYLASMRPTLAFNEPAPMAVSPAECRETIDDVDGPIRFGGGANGQFAWPCHSVERSGHYARYYTFTLTGSEARNVRMELHSSQAAGTSMFLRQGAYGSGPYMGESHNPDGAAQARIDGRLLAGTYTIEAVAPGPGDGGLFDVSIKEGPDTPAPPMGCITNLGTKSQAVTEQETSQQWNSAECASFVSSGSLSRWYTFTLN